MATHLVSAIDVRDFGAETVRVGDLNADGAPDLLFVQSTYGTREIACLTATTIHGDVLWQSGTPNRENGAIYSDLPVQVHDWDGDGRNEVLWVEQAFYADPVVWDCATGRQVAVEPCPPGRFRGEPGWVREAARRYEGDAVMHVLEGTTGRELSRFPIPAPADDSFLFADLTGVGRRADLVVKDRYWNMWGVSCKGETLWHWAGSVGHFPAVGDVDGDGRDEVFVGFALVDHDGRVIFEVDSTGAHQDAAYVVQLPDGTWRLLFGNHGIHCLSADGTELWHHPLREAQHVVAGRFREDAGICFMAIDRGQPLGGDPANRASAVLYLYDADGCEVWRRPQPPGSALAALVEADWSGAGAPREGLVYGRGPGAPAAVYDGRGEVVDTLPMRYAGASCEETAKANPYALCADVWGDSRQEVILFDARGACIWANARSWAPPTLYNETLYPGM